LLKETTGAFDGARTHSAEVSIQGKQLRKTTSLPNLDYLHIHDTVCFHIDHTLTGTSV